MEYEWDFGDGNTYTSGDPYATLHSYSSSGDYSPSLTVTDNEECPGTQHGYVTIFEVVITSVTPPNSGISFTTKDGENRIECVADLKPDSLDGTYNSQIQWDIEDEPGLSGDSGDPADPQTGNDVTLTVTVPTMNLGRNHKLNYRIRASVTIEGKTGYSNWVTIEQDDKDQLRQQYEDVSTGINSPARSSHTLVNRVTYVNLGNLTFDELNCNGEEYDGYCGNHTYQVDVNVSRRFQEVRNEHGAPIFVTSCYRCPIWNKREGGSRNSKHISGHAFDFDNGGAVENWAVAQSAIALGVDIPTSKILLYRNNTQNQTLEWLIDNDYNDTNLPPGWTMYQKGHVSTD